MEDWMNKNLVEDYESFDIRGIAYDLDVINIKDKSSFTETAHYIAYVWADSDEEAIELFKCKIDDHLRVNCPEFFIVGEEQERLYDYDVKNIRIW